MNNDPLINNITLPGIFIALESAKPGRLKSLFPLPLPAPKRVKERGAAVALPRHSGTTLFINVGWGGLMPSRATFEKP